MAEAAEVAKAAGAADSSIDAFIERWSKAGGSERANYQLFLTELCALLGLPTPDPASGDNRDNAYVFERRVVMREPDGSPRDRYIDLYRRGAFVLEAKQSGKALDTSGWDSAMVAAHKQADQYVRALPADEGRPPFIVVVDVGRNIELYAEFSRSGGNYTAFPDPKHFRIRLADLRRPDIRERLSTLWLDPMRLDPSRESARVTRQIADQLAALAKSLEAGGHGAEDVASFLMRALFTMFAEDVGLLPERGFTQLLERLHGKPANFAPMLESLWQSMNTGGFSPILEDKVLRFNGGLFADSRAIALDRDQLELLLKASRADWRYVEPAIFGTLLERALDPRERHKLGAHYTPRAYVERLVLPTIVEPLRVEWGEVQVAALAYEKQGKRKEAIEEVRRFHRQLCELRVLDPACGSGNFLYVTLEHLKRLEGEVLNLLHDLGESQGLLDLQGITVGPNQFLGLEINPRAARIAELVLWIGYLQWHFRTHGSINPPEPVLRDLKNIENRDALIACDGTRVLTGDDGKPLTRWDGLSYKPSPITGEPVPDEACQVEQLCYLAPAKAAWPAADYIVGNPPFIGAATMRRALGDGYVDAVRGTWKAVPESADFVMYWWHIAGEAVRSGAARRFGFITTNSLRQTFNRRVVQAQLEAKPPLSLAFAIPDHPWVDAADGAAVRIAMTVGAAGEGEGCLLSVRDECETDGDERNVTLVESRGSLHADLRIGANLSASVPMLANSRIANRGVQILASGFIVSPEEAERLDPQKQLSVPYRNGKDITDRPRGVMALDPYPMSELELRTRAPDVFQWLLTRAKPERDLNPRATYRDNWWLFGENQPLMRDSIRQLERFIVTAITARHRMFQFLPREVMPDQALLVVASDDALVLGVLSSRVHVYWSLASGGTLEDRPRYNKSVCFDTFPFPAPTPAQADAIRQLAEQIDAHRKRQQAAHAGLTLTGMYNVLEKLRSGEPLGAKDKTLHEQGLVSVLRTLHDELDRAVFAAYGWADLAGQLVGLPGATTPLPDKPDAQAAAEEELLTRLVALNAARAAEETQGQVHWLRPAYQHPGSATPGPHAAIETPDHASPEPAAAGQSTTTATGKAAWPKTMRDQIAAVLASLHPAPLAAAAVAATFKRSPMASVQAVLDALEDLGRVQQDAGLYRRAD